MLTNDLNLPEPIVRAIANDGYNAGRSDYTVTGLIQPPRIRALRYRHRDELTEDASDRIYSLLGQSIHTILERANIQGLAEERVYAKIDGMIVSGQLDRAIWLPDGLLQDYKLTSVWADVNKLEWEQQLNMLAHLLEVNEKPVTRLQIVAIYRDWSKTRAKRERDYPQHQARVVEVPLWEPGRALEFIRARMAVHNDARLGSLPECTDEERWYRGEEYAVMKGTNKRATRVFPFKDQAEAFASTDPKFRVEFRPGVNVRCADYCPVSDFCDQWKALERM